MPESVPAPSPLPDTPDGGSSGTATVAAAGSPRAGGRGRSATRLLLPAADAAAWFVAVLATAGLLEIATAETWASVVSGAATAALLQVAVGGLAGVYRSSFPSGSLPEARRLVAGALVVGALHEEGALVALLDEDRRGDGVGQGALGALHVDRAAVDGDIDTAGHRDRESSDT